MKALVIFAAATVVAAAAGTTPVSPDTSVTGDRFDHATHAAVTADCASCHGGITSGGSAYPAPSTCAACHDGQQVRTVDWSPPSGEAPYGLAFSHAGHPTFECAQCHQSNGDVVLANVESCLDCHGIAEHQNSAVSDCAMCHAQVPAPSSHAYEWRAQHGSEAAASPEACANCHVRSECLDCHLPDAASPAGGYHPADYLAGHPAAAYNRETECSTCHNPGQFCQSCHRQAGLVSGGRDIGAGDHDANRNFISGHGQVARQNLESCVACHTESDCLRCHTQFNPHGSDFNADTWKDKNPTVCLACHRGNIPDGN